MTSNRNGKSLIARVFDRVLPTAPDFFSLLAEQSRPPSRARR